MHRFNRLISASSIAALTLCLAAPTAAAPGNNAGRAKGYAAQRGGAAPATRQTSGARNTPKASTQYAGRPTANAANKARPAGGVKNTKYKPAAATDRKASYDKRPGDKRPGAVERPGNNKPGYNKPGNNKPGNVTINNNNNINVSGNNRRPYYPVYRPPGGGYYRPPNGGFYGPPRPPYGGWGGGYYPPSRYYYDDGPSVGGIIAGVAVTATLLALLTADNEPDVVYVQGGPPPPPYVAPKGSDGSPATINVDLGALEDSAKPSASVCITEASRQIGATGGTEIRIDRVQEVEKGNGGYRFRLILLGVYPNETRSIPMYCRATPEKIIELTFG